MSCGCCEAAESQFGEAFVARDLKRYRRKGPDKTTLAVLEAIRSSGLSSISVLDVGAGIGVIHHELLGGLADSAIHVEASATYLRVARQESARRGHSQNVRFVHADFAESSDELREADVVTLDRVICCYPDYERLVVASAAKAQKLYVASLPRERWFVKLGNAIDNALRRLRSNAFRTYVHPVAEVAALLARAGLEPCYRKTTLIWEIVGYRRAVGG